MTDARWSTAAEIAGAVNARTATAHDVVERTLSRIAADNPHLNAFTAVTAGRAREKATHVDAAVKAGRTLPLAGVPFAVKNLFDVAGLPTLAGARINRERAPAANDAVLIQRLEAAGAILVGTLNMGEYAYDFTGENAHDGPTRNPHDTARMTGGSSGGSAAAVAGGLVPIALCSDTNGSIRVPASFCGLFGLKPTYGRLPRTGTFPFVASLDHLGPLARSVADLASSYDIMQGHDPGDHACAERSAEPTLPTLDTGIDGFRIASATGYFIEGAGPLALEAMEIVARALNVTRQVDIPNAATARMAAFLLTTTEAGSLHLDRLRSRAADFDPAVRDRLIAGAMLPADVHSRVQKFRRWFRERVLEQFRDFDAILAPATPCAATKIGQTTFEVGGKTIPLRPNVGIYTQPISFIGLPVAAVPIPLEPLPVAVQIITAPGREDIALRIARELEIRGICRAPRPRVPFIQGRSVERPH